MNEGFEGKYNFSIIKKDIEPPTGEHKAASLRDTSTNRILITGVFLDGSTNHTITIKNIRIDENNSGLTVEIQEREKENSDVALDVLQTIPYRVEIRFDDELPQKVSIYHISISDEELYKIREKYT